jgi:ethanolamine ammonia-lyase large subunit
LNRADLVSAFVLANEMKEGDVPLGGTRDERLRAEARREIAALPLGALHAAAFVDDEASALLERSIGHDAAATLASLTVGEAKRRLLAPDGAAWAIRIRGGLSSEAIAAVVKLMSDDELAVAARSIFNPLPGDGIAIGSPRHFGSRIQPNSPGDDEEEILFSILEGLSYGCGDVILGVNPAADDVDTIVRLERLLARVVERLELPTRFCVLSDIVKQDAARARARVDVGFQSLAGTSRALRGIVGLGVAELIDLTRAFDGLYFETGQGSEGTNAAAEGIDMVTLEARTYGVARAIAHANPGKWMIVNDVAGFIGPEVFASGDQLERTCLEDSVMAKLHGLTMGLDVCSTFHMGLSPAELGERTARVARRAAPAYLMAVAGNADPMLGYLTTSFREHPRLRRTTGRRIATVMERRLGELGTLDASDEPLGTIESTARLFARYAAVDSQAGEASLRDYANRALARLVSRGFDLGLGHDDGFGDPPSARARIETIYRQARRALYAAIDRKVLDDACSRPLQVRTASRDRDDYLTHPASGERLRDEDRERVASLYPSRRPELQIVVSDGLNADAVNESLRALLPALRRGLASQGHLGDRDVVVTNGRVRAGYHVGQILESEAIVHLIGERPGTGLNTLSAYLTYGRDGDGRLRWSPALDHAQTTAICGIHPRGKPISAAADEIVRSVARMLALRRSGVAAPATATPRAR